MHIASDKSEPAWKKVDGHLNKANIKCKDSISLWSSAKLSLEDSNANWESAAIMGERYGLDTSWPCTSPTLSQSFGSQSSSPTFLSLCSLTVFR